MYHEMSSASMEILDGYLPREKGLSWRIAIFVWLQLVLEKDEQITALRGMIPWMHPSLTSGSPKKKRAPFPKALGLGRGRKVVN